MSVGCLVGRLVGSNFLVLLVQVLIFTPYTDEITFFYIRDSFLELSLGVLKFLSVFSVKFSESVLNLFDVHKCPNCIIIPYLEYLYLKLDNCYIFLI